MKTKMHKYGAGIRLVDWGEPCWLDGVMTRYCVADEKAGKKTGELRHPT